MKSNTKQSRVLKDSSNQNQKVEIHLQQLPCNQKQYKKFRPFCRNCEAGDPASCGFINFRGFQVSKTNGSLVYGPYFPSTPNSDSFKIFKSLRFKTAPYTRQANRYAMKKIRSILQDSLCNQLQVYKNQTVEPVFREHGPGYRQYCDVCFTSTFDYHFTCSVCALEICSDCHNKLDTATNNTLSTCSNPNIQHNKSTFVFFSKFTKGSLVGLLNSTLEEALEDGAKYNNSLIHSNNENYPDIQPMEQDIFYDARYSQETNDEYPPKSEPDIFYDARYYQETNQYTAAANLSILAHDNQYNSNNLLSKSNANYTTPALQQDTQSVVSHHQDEVINNIGLKPSIPSHTIGLKPSTPSHNVRLRPSIQSHNIGISSSCDNDSNSKFARESSDRPHSYSSSSILSQESGLLDSVDVNGIPPYHNPSGLNSNSTSHDIIHNPSTFSHLGRPHSKIEPEIKQEQYDNKNEYLNMPASQVDLQTFQQYWQLHKPALISDSTSSSVFNWSPKFFIDTYRSETVEAVDCGNNNQVVQVSAKKFFDAFSDRKKRQRLCARLGCSQILKIKDWPPRQEFQQEFPDLYQDYMDSLPVPEYCTADGYLNLANRLPEEYLPPDLGPKLFISYGSDENGDSSITNLHCDIADAVNVMYYADEKTSIEEAPAAALWHIFPFECLDKIASYVTTYKDVPKDIHPIQHHRYYLTEQDLQVLKSDYQVVPWTIYQDQGDAVFIPAGCAHQVMNYSNSIKCALDFVSPENIERSVFITEQRKTANQEDTLQIYNTLAYAWMSLKKDDKKA